MNGYDISYEILDYNKLKSRLEGIMNNADNKYQVTKHEPIGKTACGFDIEHYSIGNGPKHIVYMGGMHSNEIIGVDYVTQLMKNLALGKGDFENFDPNLFTIDFIPCQNPEGYYTTTYALNSIMGNMSPEEIEDFSKKYYLSYRQDDRNVLGINNIIKSVCALCNTTERQNELIEVFWNTYRHTGYTEDMVLDFLTSNLQVEESTIKDTVVEVWNKWMNKTEISAVKEHHQIFDGITLDCIPEIDEKHIALKQSLYELYKDGRFPLSTLANFFANSSGVNLNDNNEYYFNEVKGQMEQKGEVYATLRENNMLKSVPGPIGVPSANMESFEYAPENVALFNFLKKREEEHLDDYAFFNVHGTGGVIYIYPVYDVEKEDKNAPRDFSFYINNRLSTEYTKATGEVYESVTGKNDPYKTVGHPNRITGVGDLLRKQYIASFVLELSKMGGNPLAPYGDRAGNYNLTMVSNFKACAKTMQTILEVSHLYDSSYKMTYDKAGRVTYEEGPRR